jgi:hypothetical protein
LQHGRKLPAQLASSGYRHLTLRKGKVPIFHANNDFGTDYIAGIKEIFGARPTT